MDKHAIPRLRLISSSKEILEESEQHPSNRYRITSMREEQEDDLKRAFNAAYACNRVLLEKLVTEANVNTPNRKKHPMIFATIKRSFDDPKAAVEGTLEFLINNGACIDVAGYKHAMSAFEFATRLSIRNTEMNFRALNYFILQGANPFFSQPGRKSAYDVALNYACKSDPKKYPQAKEILDLFKNSAKTIHEAVLACNVEQVKELANQDSIAALDDHEKNPLYLAISRFNANNKLQTLEIITHLLEKGARPNQAIQKMPLPGNTHLIVATIVSIIQGDSAMIPLLLKYRGNPHFALVPGTTPSAYGIARVASQLSSNDVRAQSILGYTEEIFQIMINKHIAQDILTLFKESEEKKKLEISRISKRVQ